MTLQNESPQDRAAMDALRGAVVARVEKQADQLSDAMQDLPIVP